MKLKQKAPTAAHRLPAVMALLLAALTTVGVGPAMPCPGRTGPGLHDRRRTAGNLHHGGHHRPGLQREYTARPLFCLRV